MLVDQYRRFRSKYIVQQRRPHEYIANRYYAHLIDPFFTKIAYDLKLSPNFVTIVAGILGVTASLCFGVNELALGAVLLQLHYILDCVDGNLARLTNKCTPLGAKLDKLVDQVVRLLLFVSLAYVADVHSLLKVVFVGTIYLDIFIVHFFILPFLRTHAIVRSPWKKWVMSKGIIPAFDIFLIYILISIFALINNIEILIYVVIVGKNIDWIYRVWECLKSRAIGLQ
ncbi:CDP-alcohol phosphatidyltransferase family protein [Cohnella thailandensis]|nr:CDP-alcohol phosphatidyltransferase family protein [Cohnella thailandensis]MBP1971870.1 phosphatidylglycerophosphate synthase [Cohnella thailandensis]